MDIFGISKFVKSFFSHVYIGVNVDGKICSLKVLRIKDERVLEEFSRDFKTIDNEVPIEVVKFIRGYQKKYPFTYLSAMSKSYNQGVIKKEKNQDLSKYGINTKESKILDMKSWNIYIKNSALKENVEKFSKLSGLDYLFSPFVLIYHNVKDSFTTKTTLYVLQERSSVSLLIGDLGGIYFGGYFMVEGEVEDGVNENLNQDESDDAFVIPAPILFPTQDNDDFSDELEDLEDLDSDFFIDKLNQKLLVENQEDQAKEKVDDIVKASVVFNIIQNSLREFYSNELYESKFIEEIVVLDGYGMSIGALDYLKENMMINTCKFPVNIASELAKLSRIELLRGQL